MMMIWKIAPALAAGNAVVLKPSDTTPASSTLLAELAQEFLPPGVLNVVCGDRDTGRAVVEHPTPQMVSITGSIRAGMAGRHVGCRGAQAHPSRAGRQGTRDRLRRRRHREGGHGHRRGRLLQRRPGLHRRDPGARRAGRPRRLRRRPDRDGAGHAHGAARRRRRDVRRPQQRRPARPGHRHGRPAARPRHARDGRARARAPTGYFYEPTRALRACARTTSRSRTRSSAR